MDDSIPGAGISERDQLPAVRSRSASVGSRPINIGSSNEPRHPERQSGTLFAGHIERRTAATTLTPGLGQVLPQTGRPRSASVGPSPLPAPSRFPEPTPPSPEPEPPPPPPQSESTTSTSGPVTPPPAPQMSVEEQQLRTNIDAILAQAPGSPTLNGCIPAQQSFIIQYGLDMIHDGNKPEWAAQVCASIAILYQSGIERFLPPSIALAGETLAEAIKTIPVTGQTMRTNAEAQLETVMAQNNADLNIIKWWASNFQRQSMWQEIGGAVRHVLANQLTNEVGVQHYSFGDEHIACKEHYDRLLPEWKTKLLPSIAFYKAFTAIALAKVEVPGKGDGTITVQRGFNLANMQAQYPPPEQWNIVGGEITRLPGRTMDSTSLGPPSSLYSNEGNVVLEFKIPISRVFSAYFLSSMFCCDDISFNSDKKKMDDIFVSEHEIVCDVSQIKGKIVSLK